MKPGAEGSNGDPREIRLSAAVTQHAAAFLLAGPPLAPIEPKPNCSIIEDPSVSSSMTPKQKRLVVEYSPLLLA